MDRPALKLGHGWMLTPLQRLLQYKGVCSVLSAHNHCRTYDILLKKAFDHTIKDKGDDLKSDGLSI